MKTILLTLLVALGFSAHAANTKSFVRIYPLVDQMGSCLDKIEVNLASDDKFLAFVKGYLDAYYTNNYSYTASQTEALKQEHDLAQYLVSIDTTAFPTPIQENIVVEISKDETTVTFRTAQLNYFYSAEVAEGRCEFITFKIQAY